MTKGYLSTKKPKKIRSKKIEGGKGETTFSSGKLQFTGASKGKEKEFQAMWQAEGSKRGVNMIAGDDPPKGSISSLFINQLLGGKT